MVNTNIAKRALRILDIARRMAEKIGGYEVHNRIYEIQLHFEGYSEPGYDAGASGIVATGNWNSISRWDEKNRTYHTNSDLPVRIGNLFEKMGIEIEWSAEWTDCSNCGKLVRTSGDSYSWQPSFVEGDGELTCTECIQENPEEHLQSLEDNPDMFNTIEDINPADHGYTKLNDFENGWYGIEDSPTKIAKGLREKGVHRFLFNLDGNEQFRSKFSVWVHADDMPLLRTERQSRLGKDGKSCTLVSESEYQEATDNDMGFCIACKEFTTGGCEPDAEKYPCEACERTASVYGAEQALLIGLIDIGE